MNPSSTISNLFFSIVYEESCQIGIARTGRSLYILNMRPNFRLSGQRDESFIEKARRKQIVDTAIRTIAARGYSQTSLAEIAREAGISKGVISYHFEGKGDLIEEILARLMHEPAEYIKGRVDSRAEAVAEGARENGLKI